MQHNNCQMSPTACVTKFIMKENFVRETRFENNLNTGGHLFLTKKRVSVPCLSPFIWLWAVSGTTAKEVERRPATFPSSWVFQET